MKNMKLGKKPATVDHRDFQFSALRTGAPLPPRPKTFGHATLPSKRPWGMLANDRFGCCVFASAAHLVMLWNELAGRKVEFNDECVLSDYSAVTGFDSSDPSTDQGTNMRDMLNYWRKVGIVDARGIRHKIGAYVSVNPKNLDHVKEAVYLFDAANIGFTVTQSVMDDFYRGHTWDRALGPVEGGHCVPVTDQGLKQMKCITWNKAQPMTDRFFTAQTDECFAILTEESLHNGKSEDGFDKAQLQQWLGAVK